NIPIPYAQQPEPEEIQYPEKPSEHYAYRRCFKASRHTTEAEPHFGLGLPCYTRVTSPMRRYLDLFVHQQLRAFLTTKADSNKENIAAKIEHEAVIERIGLADEGSRAARKAERSSNQHWTLLYLKQEEKKQGKAWQGDAIVVFHDERKTSLILPDLALEPKIRLQNHLELNQTVMVEATSVNIPDLWAGFRLK
ncbi:MAG TPA: RNB domain-containing ribonuclease, partial [Leucothrix sp.]|nr:RNB domain-containing ribonuclease [Leucothrix sp.]